ncbi:tat pathway signal sequence [Colletotrichum cereale]|nr:tat pathway signal sequence [Colletotrichum cereale]
MDMKKTVSIKEEPYDSPESSPEVIYVAPRAATPEITKATPLDFDFKAIERVQNSDDTAVLERAVEVGIEMARDLAPLISHLASLDTSSTARKDDGFQWKEGIEEILSLAVPTRTTIGVVGATGSGKSSLVNALLGEEKLLPTSCTRACTAWVTEVSYNYSDDENATYKAEIEFVTEHEWLKEMGSALDSIKDEIVSGSTDYSRPTTEAGMAFLRLTAVYPGLTPQTVAETERETLMENTDVQKILGRTISLVDVSAKGLSDQMQAYVGRKAQDKEGDGLNPWPMIKVIRIFTKAPALSTGAVIADLPGIQDSNAARAEVANNYMKDCSGLWIVAPIVRAVDDKSAKDLLGDSFRNQMLLDHRYSAITFICSKTDDIKIDEASGELGLTMDIQSNHSKIASLTDEMPALEDELKALKQHKAEDADTLDTCRDELDESENALRRIQGGQQLGPATANLGKRKHASDNSSIVDSSMDTGAGNNPWTEEQAEEHIYALRAQVQILRDRVKVATATVKQKEQELEEKLQERKLLKDSVKEACIQKRNWASAQRIRQDFADGIRELDEMNAPGPNDLDFDAKRVVRDYEKFRAELPVFCVSSQAYQKLSGMMRNEDFSTSGYKGIDDTRIPGLQAHAQKLTEANRNARCRRILVKLGSLLTSISCWVTGHDLKRVGFDPKTVEEHLRAEADKLKKNWRVSRENCTQSFRSCLENGIYGKFNDVIAGAAENALGLTEVWFADHRHGGYSTVTLKAVFKKDGKHTTRGRSNIDLHQDLASPIQHSIAHDWSRVFQGHLPLILSQYNSELLKYQHEFHRVITDKYRANGNMAMALNLLDNLIGASSEAAAVLLVELNSAINDYKVKASGAMFPPIAKAMEPVYRKCVVVQGSGSKVRMQQLVDRHIKKIQRTVFRESVEAMEGHLRDMERHVANKLKAEVDKMHDAIFRDYSNALLSDNQRVKLSPVELKLKRELTIVLNSTKSRFGALQRAAVKTVGI